MNIVWRMGCANRANMPANPCDQVFPASDIKLLTGVQACI